MPGHKTETLSMDELAKRFGVKTRTEIEKEEEERQEKYRKKAIEVFESFMYFLSDKSK